jgi:hypothetical protein
MTGYRQDQIQLEHSRIFGASWIEVARQKADVGTYSWTKKDSWQMFA